MQNLFNDKLVKVENTDYPLSYSQIIGNIYYILQVHLIKDLSLGNVFIDTIFHFTILSIIIHIIINFKSIFNYIFYFLKSTFSNNSKTVTISNKSLKFFNSVKWYLSAPIKCDNEITNNNGNLEYFYDDKIKLVNKYLLSSNNPEIDREMRRIPLLPNKYIKICKKDFTLEFLYENIKLHDDSDIKLIFTNIKKDNSIDDFFNDCIISYENYLKQIPNIIYKNVNNIWIPDGINNFNYNFDSMVLDTNLKYKIITDIQNFINSKNKFDFFNILHKRSYLFYGANGTGKTMSINYIAKYFNYKIYYLNLDNIISDDNLIKLLNKIDDENSILVVENISIENNTFINSCVKNNKYNKIYNNENNIVNLIYNNHFLSKLLIFTTNFNCKNDYNNIPLIDVKFKFNNCSIDQFKFLYNKFYKKAIPYKLLTKIKTCLFSPFDLIKIYLNNINNEQGFLLEISKKNVVDINKDIYNNFNTNIKSINNNNKLILSAIILGQFSYLLKNVDYIKKNK